MRKKGNTVLAGLIICLLLVFLAAAGKLFGAYLKYQKGDVSYEKLQEYVQEPEEEESPESEKEKEEPKNRYLEIDFAGLKAVNPDVIAWIQIPALDISYPVVQGKDNAYYLHHLFSGESNINGSIFVDCHNQPDFTDQNTIVYGHNMKNGSMFGTLDKYQDKELFEQHPEFYLYLPDKILKYRIFSCYAGRTGSEGYRYHFPEAEDFQTFLDTVFYITDNMMLELYASMAQAELEKKEKRQREGIEAKKLRGEWDDYGRPSVMKQETFDENFQSVVSGETTPTQLRKNLGMTHSTFYRYRKTFYEKYPELSNSAN